MTDLTKTRTILTHSHSVERGPVFDAADVDGGRLTVLTLDESVWVDMGSPEQITVTIEPGDLLNDLETAARREANQSVERYERSQREDASSSLGGEPGTTERAFNEAEGDRSE